MMVSPLGSISSLKGSFPWTSTRPPERRTSADVLDALSLLGSRLPPPTSLLADADCRSSPSVTQSTGRLVERRLGGCAPT